MAIHKRFEKVMQELNLSQVEFAEMVGSKQSIISRVISGKVKLSFDAMQVLHSKFHINLNWLICGSEKMYMKNYLKSTDSLNEPMADYGVSAVPDPWQEAVKAKDELIDMQRAEIKRLKVKCGETK
jgi:transcriptional regulator with XRE-family HTH domain